MTQHISYQKNLMDQLDFWHVDIAPKSIKIFSWVSSKNNLIQSNFKILHATPQVRVDEWTWFLAWNVNSGNVKDGL